MVKMRALKIPEFQNECGRTFVKVIAEEKNKKSVIDSSVNLHVSVVALPHINSC
jgi:hypothetical protein